MKYILLILFLSIAITKVHTQNYSWYPQNSPTTFGFSGIDFINNQTGWISCYGSTTSPVLKTSNGGINWQLISAINNLTISDIDFINSQTGWVCGEYATEPKIYISTNSGFNWQEQNLPPGLIFGLYSIHFTNENIGFSVGEMGYIFKTTNLGINWLRYPNSSENDDLKDIFFLNNSTGWIAGGTETGYIYKTTNTGGNWFRSQFFFQAFESAFFVNYQKGYAAGSNGQLHGMVNVTTNSGANWIGQFFNPVEIATSLYFIDSLNGWFTTINTVSGGSIYRTTNGGLSWYIEFNSINSLRKVIFTDSINGWVIGEAGRILKYGDITYVNSNYLIPEKFVFSQNYPNPFNPSTTIRFSILHSKGARG